MTSHVCPGEFQWALLLLILLLHDKQIILPYYGPATSSFSIALSAPGYHQTVDFTTTIDWDHNKPIAQDMDFSQYGGLALEWKSYVHAHPMIDQPWTRPSEEETLTGMHIAGNNARAAHDQLTLKAHDLEGKSSSQDAIMQTRDGSSIRLRIYNSNDTPSP